jgi:hypothetical protein
VGGKVLGGAVAEVDGEGDAVAVETGEDGDLGQVRMLAEDGLGGFGEEDGAAPAVGYADILKGGVELTDAGFEPSQSLGGWGFANIDSVEVVSVVTAVALRRVDQAGTENGGIAFC